MIHIPKNLYDKLMEFPSEVSEEQGCLLVGSIKKEASMLETTADVFVNYLAQKKLGTSVRVVVGNTAETLMLIDSLGLISSESIVGWAHTHPWPGKHNFFSSTDVNTQELLQKSRKEVIALVMSQTGMNAYKVIGEKPCTLAYQIVSPTKKPVFLEELL